jgi:DNA primase
VGRTYDPKMEKKKKYDNPKSDKDRIIFNEGLVNWDSTVYLVEGAFEMLSFPVNIIPMLGKTISTTLYLKLKEMKPDVVVLLDPDAYKSSIDLYYKLHTLYVDCEERVRIVKLPTMDDLDNLRKKFGIDEVIKSLRGARGLTVDDYFVNKLQKPYDRKGYGRYDSNSKHFEWKSSGRGNIF